MQYVRPSSPERGLDPGPSTGSPASQAGEPLAGLWGVLVREDTLPVASRGRPAALGVPRLAEGRRGRLWTLCLHCPARSSGGTPAVSTPPPYGLQIGCRWFSLLLTSCASSTNPLGPQSRRGSSTGFAAWPVASWDKPHPWSGLWASPEARPRRLGSVTLWFPGLQGAPAFLRGTLPSQDPCKPLGDRWSRLDSGQGIIPGFSLLTWKMGMSAAPASGSHREVDRFTEALAP